MDVWKKFFVKMAEGKIPFSNFYVLHDTTSNAETNVNSSSVSVNLISPTQQAVDQSKAALAELPIREREVEELLNKDALEGSRVKRIAIKRKIDTESKYTPSSKKNKRSIWG